MGRGSISDVGSRPSLSDPGRPQFGSAPSLGRFGSGSAGHASSVLFSFFLGAVSRAPPVLSEPQHREHCYLRTALGTFS
ncbi:hypothetical protein NL676_010109 [Syzygium grande]|nr:hypothetical protein NL676_010109 [Syzygium grande]